MNFDSPTTEKPDKVHEELGVPTQGASELQQAASAAAELEHSMGVWQCVKLYPKAVFFSMAMSLCLVQEGYDTSVIGAFFAQPAFQRRFGIPAPDGSYQIPVPWQSGLLNATAVGEIFGLWFAGILAERIGYKKTLLAGLTMLTGAIFISFFANSLGMLMAGDILCGIPWGAFQTITITYAADVCPHALRGVLTSFVNMCWVTGALIATGVNRGVVDIKSDWGWKIPFALQWIWPLPIGVAIFLAPESPYWLVRKGRLDDARVSLQRLTSKKNTNFNVDNSIALIIQTNEREKAISAGASYRDIFRGIDLRRTEITVLTWVAQVSCGQWFGGNVTYFLEQFGFPADKAFDFGVGTMALGWSGTLVAWWIMTRVGRRKMYLCGMGAMLTILLMVGFMGIAQPTASIAYASAALQLLFLLIVDLTIGPVVYTIVSEIPSTRLKIKTVVFGRNIYNIASICANFLNAPILNPLGWNLRGKGGFVWAGPCFLSLLWGFFRLPETKGLTYEEIDVLFENKVNSRRFTRALAQEYMAQEREQSENYRTT